MTMKLDSIRLRGSWCVNLVLISSLAYCWSPAQSLDPILTPNCSSSVMYSSANNYQQNRNTLLFKMKEEASTSGYNNDTEGTGSGQVYGSYLCQGKLPATNCSDCVTDAVEKILKMCPNQLAARAWYDSCNVRFSNENFFGDMIVEDWVTWCGRENYSTNSSTAAAFDKVLYDTLAQVAKLAAGDKARFATMEADLTIILDKHTTLYTSAQCVLDISNDSCLQCLKQSTNHLPDFCNSTKSGRTICSSCVIRYDVNPFYTPDKVAVSPSSAVLLPVLPPTGNVPYIKPKKKGKGLFLILGILTPIAVLLTLGMWCYFRNHEPLDDVDGIDMEEITSAESFQMDFNKVRAATLNFAPDKKLGEGGFGDVFKAWRLWKENAELEMLDSALRDSYSMEELVKCIHIGLLCIQEDAGKRPKMNAVVAALSGKSVDLPGPTPPNFFNFSRTFSVSSGSTTATTGNFTTTGSSQSSSLFIPDSSKYTWNEIWVSVPESYLLNKLLLLSASRVPHSENSDNTESSINRKKKVTDRRLIEVKSSTDAAQSLDPVITKCPSDDTNSPSVAYQHYRKKLLIKMESESSISGFNNDTEGTGSDQVYEILTNCPNNSAAQTWYDECNLKYSDENFFGILIVQDWTTWCGYGDYIKNSSAAAFNKVLYDTLTKVAEQAAIDEARFATKEADLTFLHDSATTLYTSAQCVPDLSPATCLQCLIQSINHLPDFCNNTKYGRTICSSCIIWHNVDKPFYTADKVATSPSSAAALPPVFPPTNGNGPSIPQHRKIGKGQYKLIPIVILTPIVAVLLALGIWCYFGNQEPLNKFEGTDMEEITSAESFQMDFSKVRAATLNFAPDKKLGEGGFGDVFKGCNKCVESATKSILRLCPGHQNAAVWNSECTLHYATEDHDQVNMPWAWWYSLSRIDQVVKNQAQFDDSLSVVMSSLIEKATANSRRSTELYATGEAIVTVLDTLYGTVECSPSETRETCRDCLWAAMARAAGCCDGSRAAEKSEKGIAEDQCEKATDMVCLPQHVISMLVILVGCFLYFSSSCLGGGFIRHNVQELVGAKNKVNFLTQYCAEEGNYAEGSTFEANLHLLLSNLTLKAQQTKFHNFTVGESSSRVYGLFLCRGDKSAEFCRDCVKAAANAIQLQCPFDVEAMVWYEECILRYANRSMFGVGEVAPVYYFHLGPLNYDNFDDTLIGTLRDLVGKVVPGNSSLAFASKAVNVTNYLTLDCYVECTPDISESVCKRCLGTALARFETFNDGGQYAVLLQPSCRLRSEYHGVMNPDPYTPNSNHSNGEKKGLSNLYATLLLLLSSAATMIFMTVAFCLYKQKVRGSAVKTLYQAVDDMESIENLQFDFAAIKRATENFLEANQIGQGGFGAIYKYIRAGHFSAKSDVYSFGVILLELVSGSLRYSVHTLEEEEDILSLAWKLWSSGDSFEFVDLTIRDGISTVDAIRYIQVGLLCVQESPSKRPNMETVITMLNSPSMVLPLPTTPWIFDVHVSNSSSSADTVEFESGSTSTALEIDME
ncbi:hypothetical protein V2J09_019319 [Rumex salicifolius]